MAGLVVNFVGAIFYCRGGLIAGEVFSIFLTAQSHVQETGFPKLGTL